jgi:pSer/pThr/pTyr-binding forkhead associated (FHA) protein
MTAIVFLILRILLSLSLYAFLLLMFFTLWNDIKQQGKLLSNRKIPAISFKISSTEGLENKFFIDKDEVTIGRESSCDCQLDDETVSSYHARLKYHHNQWWLEDLGSTNGTSINEQLVSTPIVVISGDGIKCGKHTIMIEISRENLHNTTTMNTNGENGEFNG